VSGTQSDSSWVSPPFPGCDTGTLLSAHVCSHIIAMINAETVATEITEEGGRTEMMIFIHGL